MTHIDRTWLLGLLRAARRDAIEYELDEGLDVRLQVLGEDAWIHTGDASYDQDLRGYWGEGVLYPSDTDADLGDLADQLIAQADDACAEWEAGQ